jgi:diguanylate cyclase (GGDEF)-like protein
MRKKNRSKSSVSGAMTELSESQPQRARDPIRWLIVCGILLIAAIAAGTAIMISNTRDRALESGERELENTVLLLARHFDQQLEDFEVVQNDLVTQLRLAGTNSPDVFKREMSTFETHLKMKAKVSGSSDVAGVNVYDAEGTLINSSEAWPVPTVNIADRAYFRTLKAGPASAPHQIELVSSAFSRGVVTVIARKMTGPNGEFLGVVTRGFSPAKFEDFFSSVALGNDAAISMHHRDGVLLARYPHVEEAIGKNFKTGPALQVDLLNSDRGTARLISPVDGQERLVSVRSLSRFPLTVLATTTVASALANWRAQTMFIVAAAILSALVVAVILSLIVRQLSRQHQSSQRRLALEKLRLDTAVDNMTQGLTLFDQARRLVVCNQRYLEIYGLSPDVVKPGCRFRDLLVHRKETGSLEGDVDEYYSRILESIARGESVVNLARGGRSIQVTHCVVADGGWVATHEDITERISHEEDIFQQATELARTNMRFDAALSNMTQGLCLFDADQKLVVANSRFREMYNFPQELVQPGTPLAQILEHHARQGATSDLTFDERQVFLPGDGRVISIRRTPTSDGGWVDTHEDVTAQRRSEQLIAEKASELEVMNARFDAALSNMSQGLCMFDGEKRLVVWNDRYAELYQLPADLLKVGTPHDAIMADRISRGILKGEVSDSAVQAKIAALAQLPRDAASSRVDEFADGRLMLVTRQPMADGGWLATHEDITERRRAEAEIVHLARHDALTGLANRAEFNAKLEEASKRLRRNGGAVAVMMLDLDRFKAVNDTLGHPAGDQLLIEVGRRLQSTIRETDVLARLGGDEFAIIQEGGDTQREGSATLALKIINAISQPYDLNGHQASVGTSIGIALAPEHGVEPEELLKSADLALYDAKANGRNDFRVFRTEMIEVANTQKSAENELRLAIERNEFELHYQPVVHADTRALHGVEALVRWRHPTKGLVAPEQFISLAESTNLMVPLGGWILRQACTDAVAWPASVKIAVNISAAQFSQGNLFDVVLSTLVETGLSPERLELEITETALLNSHAAHVTTIRRLKNLGVSIVLDDFGIGYSSVNYLINFPVDKIKIDKLFTRDAPNQKDRAAVISSVLALAQGLGIATTAAGVETDEEFKFLRGAGVNLVQGYLFGRPVPVSEFDETKVAWFREMVA